MNNESKQDKDNHHSYDENSSQSSSDEGIDSAEDDDAQKEIEPHLSSGISSNNQNNENDTTQKKITLKKGMHVRYKTKDDGNNWYSAKLISRSGKATGKYKNEWNVENDEDGKHVVDFDHVDRLEEAETTVEELEENGSTEVATNEEIHISEIYHMESSQEVSKAKNKELTEWLKHQVYEEVEDTGQKCISVRWVITPKLINGQYGTKARLCARGFEEDVVFRTDSPTCMRESVKVVLCIITTLEWNIRSIDFKTAFLQGKSIDREVYTYDHLLSVILKRYGNYEKLFMV